MSDSLVDRFPDPLSSTAENPREDVLALVGLSFVERYPEAYEKVSRSGNKKSVWL